MDNDLLKAKQLLLSEAYTCVLCKDEIIYKTVKRGVLPLVEWLEAEEVFCGFSAADKIVGKAAAFLYVLADVKSVYAPVMSESAVYTLARNGILPFCDITVKEIINREGNGCCPMEDAVRDILVPSEAFEVIKKKLRALPLAIKTVKTDDKI